MTPDSAAPERVSDGLLTDLERAKAEVHRIEREIAQGPCRQYGHDWKHIGGRWCGCDGGSCSVPVHECAKCGDCDYGDNAEASAKIEECEAEYLERRALDKKETGR